MFSGEDGGGGAMRVILSNGRVQPIFCKDSANERNESLTLKLPSAAYLMQSYD